MQNWRHTLTIRNVARRGPDLGIPRRGRRREWRARPERERRRGLRLENLSLAPAAKITQICQCKRPRTNTWQ
eukprot:532614-Lingulodinium_polyedra.AAC.1